MCRLVSFILLAQLLTIHRSPLPCSMWIHPLLAYQNFPFEAGQLGYQCHQLLAYFRNALSLCLSSARMTLQALRMKSAFQETGNQCGGHKELFGGVKEFRNGRVSMLPGQQSLLCATGWNFTLRSLSCCRSGCLRSGHTKSRSHRYRRLSLGSKSLCFEGRVKRHLP